MEVKGYGECYTTAIKQRKTLSFFARHLLSEEYVSSGATRKRKGTRKMIRWQLTCISSEKHFYPIYSILFRFLWRQSPFLLFHTPSTAERERAVFSLQILFRSLFFCRSIVIAGIQIYRNDYISIKEKILIFSRDKHKKWEIIAANRCCSPFREKERWF